MQEHTIYVILIASPIFKVLTDPIQVVAVRNLGSHKFISVITPETVS